LHGAHKRFRRCDSAQLRPRAIGHAVERVGMQKQRRVTARVPPFKALVKDSHDLGGRISHRRSSSRERLGSLGGTVRYLGRAV